MRVNAWANCAHLQLQPLEFHPPNSIFIMSLHGQAFLGIWHGIKPGHERDYDDWHTYEHMPERAGVPGFNRARRYMNWDLEQVSFTMYEGAHHETFRSPTYLARLNDPTEGTKRISGYQTHFLRGAFEVQGSLGAGIGGALGTFRLRLASGDRPSLVQALSHVGLDVTQLHGVVGVHLGVAQRDITSEKTSEMDARGSSAAENELDAVLLVETIGFDEIKGLVDQVTQMLSINGVEAVDAAPYHLAYLLPGASQ